jgi:hypothetical protein
MPGDPDTSAASAGPYVSMAVFCQRLDQQPDGTVDVIGVVDGVRVDATMESADAEAALIRLMGLVSIRAGQVRGRHAMALRAHFPSGDLGASLNRQVELTDREPGATISFPIELQAHEAGTYWFDVFFDERLLTRIPLIVEHG